jgi:hypothetical protein
MTPQQKCAERIYELLPHKKELEFGCEVKHKKRGTGKYVGINKRLKNLWFDNEEEPIYAIDIGGNSEIIGQKLGIADILLAMRKSGYPIGHYYTQEILGIGTFENSKKRYNLEKDNILDQLDDFCEFLLELLK